MRDDGVRGVVAAGTHANAIDVDLNSWLLFAAFLAFAAAITAVVIVPALTTGPLRDARVGRATTIVRRGAARTAPGGSHARRNRRASTIGGVGRRR